MRVEPLLAGWAPITLIVSAAFIGQQGVLCEDPANPGLQMSAKASREQALSSAGAFLTEQTCTFNRTSQRPTDIVSQIMLQSLCLLCCIANICGRRQLSQCCLRLRWNTVQTVYKLLQASENQRSSHSRLRAVVSTPDYSSSHASCKSHTKGHAQDNSWRPP